MVQWFKSLIVKLFNIKPYSYDLNIGQIDKIHRRTSLVVYSNYKESGVQAILKRLEAEKVECLYNLAQFAGSADELKRLQGRLEAVQSFLSFIVGAGSMTPEQASALRKIDSPEEKKGTVVYSQSFKSKQDVSI